MGSADKFCLRWNDFESTMSSSFRELRETNEFFDVTLCCDNGSDTVQAHKVILAACSPLFRRILSQNTHHNPFLYLKGIHVKELQNVLNFMYHGEVSVAQDSLNKFLAVAEELAVKGLTTLETNDAAPTFYDQDDEEEEDVERHPPKRTSTAKKSKRQSSAAAAKRKVDADVGDSSIEVDLKRIKADPDEDDGRGDNGEMFEGEDYEGLPPFEDDFDDSVAGGSGQGTSGGDSKASVQFIPSKRGGVMLVDHLSYTYTKHRNIPTTGGWAWRCTERSICQLTAKTGPNGELVYLPVHNHPPREKQPQEPNRTKSLLYPELDSF